MDSDSLFESLYTEDAEGKKLAEFPAISELIERYPFLIKIYDFQTNLFKSRIINS